MNANTTGNDILSDFQNDDLSLFELLDHILGKGIVIAGEITISVANVDLLFLGVNVLAGSIDTINKLLPPGDGK